MATEMINIVEGIVVLFRYIYTNFNNIFSYIDESPPDDIFIENV